MFYKQSRDVDRFLSSTNSVSRLNYMRILVLASIDIVLTLPFGIVNMVLGIKSSMNQDALTFYAGWTATHSTDWAAGSITYAELKGFGTASLALQYFIFWTAPFLSFVIFGLFGMTAEARASYWQVLCAIGSLFGWKPVPLVLGRANRKSELGIMQFGARPQDTVSLDVEMGCVCVLPVMSRH